MLLITADLLRSLWLFAFTIVNLLHGLTQTHDPFCQASGFFLQVAYGMAGVYNDESHVSTGTWLMQDRYLGSGHCRSHRIANSQTSVLRGPQRREWAISLSYSHLYPHRPYPDYPLLARFHKTRTCIYCTRSAMLSTSSPILVPLSPGLDSPISKHACNSYPLHYAVRLRRTTVWHLYSLEDPWIPYRYSCRDFIPTSKRF